LSFFKINILILIVLHFLRVKFIKKFDRLLGAFEGMPIGSSPLGSFGIGFKNLSLIFNKKFF